MTFSFFANRFYRRHTRLEILFPINTNINNINTTFLWTFNSEILNICPTYPCSLPGTGSRFAFRVILNGRSWFTMKFTIYASAYTWKSYKTVSARAGVSRVAIRTRTVDVRVGCLCSTEGTRGDCPTLPPPPPVYAMYIFTACSCGVVCARIG